jgi:hypothetical protein
VLGAGCLAPVLSYDVQARAQVVDEPLMPLDSVETIRSLG